MKQQLHNDLQVGQAVWHEEVLYLDAVLKDVPESASHFQKLHRKRESLKRAIKWLNEGLASVKIED